MMVNLAKWLNAQFRYHHSIIKPLVITSYNPVRVISLCYIKKTRKT